MLTLNQINQASISEFVAMLDGTYEHSPWIAERAASSRPFTSFAALKLGLIQAVRNASVAEQVALIRAHPELAGKAMVAKSLTAESTNEQSKAGLTHCSHEEFTTLQTLNAQYNKKFGFPFILAVRGPRGLGLSRLEIISTFERRLENHADFELAECLRNIHRIAEIRLNDKFGIHPAQGDVVMQWADELAVHSDPGFKEHGELTVTYLTDAHRACSEQFQTWMRECGFDRVSVDAVGNVVAVYEGSTANEKRLMTGSHFDTVRNGGRYDGRLGIFVPMLCVKQLKAAGKRLPFGIEVVAFSEEEGQRYKATFLGSGALTGDFEPMWLEQKDSAGIVMRDAMRAAGLDPAKISGIRRDPANYLGFVEVHIEQGPVLNAKDIPLGVVTSINGSCRFVGEIIGQASHAGTTPMGQRHDAAAAIAEFMLYLEERASSVPDVVATVGMLEVPNGSINVVPGKVKFSLDIRATTDSARDACVSEALEKLASVCERRGVNHRLEKTMQAAAAPSAPAWQARWENAVKALGLPVFRMPSGAGHDAMKLHEIMPQAMLFTRGLNSGISHNPLESITNDDAELTVQAFQHLLEQLEKELG